MIYSVLCFTNILSNKQKHTFVTFHQRLLALKRLDRGESVQQLCNDLNVKNSTVNDWRRNRKSIETFCTQIESDKTLSSRSTLKTPKLELVNNALLLWFLQERRRGTPISGLIFKEKALALHAELLGEKDEFLVSNGWLWRCKKRHDILFLRLVYTFSE